MRKILLCLASILMAAGVPAGAQDTPKWNVTAEGGAAYVAPTFTWRNELMSTFVYPAGSIAVGYQTTEEDSPYAALYGFPNFGVGLGWEGPSSLKYNGLSRLDNILNLYGFAERSLLRGEKVSLDFVFDLGAGYNRSLYDPERNPLNLNFSSHFLIFVSTGLALRVELTSHLEAGLSARLNHYSAGRLAYPNGGLNSPAAFLSLRYRNAKAPRHRVRPEFEAPSRFFYEIYAGGGVHKCSLEWLAFGTTPSWPIYAFGASANFRYRPHLSTGLALDFYCSSSRFLDRLEESERKLCGDEEIDAYGTYDRLSAGIGVIQHLHYGNVSAFATVGTYLYRHSSPHDQRGKLYQRIGLKYLLPGHTGLFVAADCKAHGFSRAAMMELTLGIRI